jgi:hypothetical protein
MSRFCYHNRIYPISYTGDSAPGVADSFMVAHLRLLLLQEVHFSGREDHQNGEKCGDEAC